MAAVGVGVWELSVCLSDSGDGGRGEDCIQLGCLQL